MQSAQYLLLSVCSPHIVQVHLFEISTKFLTIFPWEQNSDRHNHNGTILSYNLDYHTQSSHRKTPVLFLALLHDNGVIFRTRVVDAHPVTDAVGGFVGIDRHVYICSQDFGVDGRQNSFHSWGRPENFSVIFCDFFVIFFTFFLLKSHEVIVEIRW